MYVIIATLGHFSQRYSNAVYTSKGSRLQMIFLI